MTMMAVTGTGRENGRMTPQVSLTALERALLRLLAGLQSRCGVSSLTRLLVLAVLNAWV